MLLEQQSDATHGAQWRLRCLANYAGGRPISYANDLAIARNGCIYFSDSSVIGPAINEASPKPWCVCLRVGARMAGPCAGRFS
jgi:sugar lactone lactonase YvrE